MRIAFFTDTYLPDVNGISYSIHLLREALEKKGHEVYVFAPSSRTVKMQNTDSRIIYFSSASFKRNPDFRIAIFPFVRAIEKVRSLGIEIIHNHAIGTMALAALRCKEKLKVNALTTFHHLHYLNDSDFRREVVANYIKWLYSHFGIKTTTSTFSSKKLFELGISSEVIPNPIDYSFFSKRRAKRRVYDFIYAGSLQSSKNLKLLIESARNIRNVVKKDLNFVIVGAGEEKNHLEDLSFVKGVSDYFLWFGLISRNKLAELFWKTKTFLYTSSLDSFSLSLIEAMASGVVPVVPENSFAKDFVKEGENGFVWRDDLDFYRKAVESLNVDNRFRKNAIESAKQFDIKRVVLEYEKIYETLSKK